jgi:predicted NBD/HSP70 family sugar kinase
MNLRATFDLVASDGAVAATRIAQETGLSKPTVSEVLRQLLELGLIRKVGRTTGQIGPSAQLYGVDQRAGWVLAVDVGEVWIRAVAADLSGQVIAKADERTKSQRARLMIEQIDVLAAQVAVEAGSTKPYLAVLGTPGVIRPGEGHLALARMVGWERPEVLEDLRARLAVPVVFENDVNLAGIGELSRGAGRGVDDFVLISVGSGVGMAVVLNGSLHRGASGLAGEIGYLPIGNVRPSGRGSARWHEGALERSISSPAILELAKEAGLGPITSAAAVIDEARAGNEAALGVVATIAERLAYGVAAVAAVLDPELVVLGGGIGTGAGQLLIEPLRRVLTTISPLRPRMAVSDLGSGAVLIGAVSEGVRLVKEQLFGNENAPGVIASGRLPATASGREETTA